jgi:hypothetical protein
LVKENIVFDEKTANIVKIAKLFNERKHPQY